MPKAKKKVTVRYIDLSEVENALEELAEDMGEIESELEEVLATTYFDRIKDLSSRVDDIHHSLSSIANTISNTVGGGCGDC